MSLLFVAPDRNSEDWIDAIKSEAPHIDIDIWPDVTNTARAQFAVCWNQPAHSLESFPNLKAVTSVGAGVDHILADKTIPDELPVCRIVLPEFAQQMKEYIFAAVLNYQRKLGAYAQQQKKRVWQTMQPKSCDATTIGVMGLGAIGRPVAEALASFGYTVRGWTKSETQIQNVETFYGPPDLSSFTQQCEVIACLLPLTPATRDILNLDLFRQIRHPGYIINAARGAHLVEEDLIYALNKGWLSGACLDVFLEEPLPEKHPFWNCPSITITPHIAAITPPQQAACQIVANYKRLLSGQPLVHTVNRHRGY